MRPKSTWLLAEGNAGLLSQAIGLSEAAGLPAEHRTLTPRGLWRHVPAALWPHPLTAITPDALVPPLPELLIGCGGKAAAVLAAMRHRVRTVIVQHPRMSIRKFDLVMAVRHDELTGPNVIVTRTALHRVTPERLAAAAVEWAPRLAHLPRPLVAVLVGGNNGRFRLDATVAGRLAGQLAAMMRLDDAGLIVTPSRRTAPEVRRVLERALRPLGAHVHDLGADNPYFGMLALADAIIVTGDSVSMMSEAVATRAPVLLADLPGRSRRIGLFARALIADGRARPFTGRLAMWEAAPIDDTRAAAAEMCKRFGYAAPADV